MRCESQTAKDGLSRCIPAALVEQRDPIGDTMRAMEELVRAGKIRYIGVSNFTIDYLRQAQAALSREKIVCNQVLYHLRSRGIENQLQPYCEAQNIAVVAYSPFGQRDFPSSASRQGKALSAIASKHGRTSRQVALNFLTRRPSVFTIPKAANPDHVRENAGGAGWNLDPEDLQGIDKAFPKPAAEEPLDML
jgi:diketogulonate reductase-like aldo/keto reductase